MVIRSRVPKELSLSRGIPTMFEHVAKWSSGLFLVHDMDGP